MKLHTTPSERFIQKQPNLANDGTYLLVITHGDNTTYTETIEASSIDSAQEKAQVRQVEAEKATTVKQAELFSPGSHNGEFHKASNHIQSEVTA